MRSNPHHPYDSLGYLPIDASLPSNLSAYTLDCMDENTRKELEKRFAEQVHDINNFVFELAEESDRSAVILGATRLDNALERLLKNSMHHYPDGKDNLFDPDRPLSSFSAKIALAYRLGLIDRNIEHALQMLRRIRNDFAHSLEKASISDGSQQNRVREMVQACRHWSH